MDGTFRVLTEMVCAATESVCSTAVKLFLGVKNFKKQYS